MTIPGQRPLATPAVADGITSSFSGTLGAGSLCGIQTGAPRDDDWPMWGGSAAHNGT